MKNLSQQQLQFPCEFLLKAMGAADSLQQQTVFTIAKKHIPELQRQHLYQTSSKEGNYVSITVSFTAQSQDQLRAIYQELMACEQVITVL